MAPASLPPVLAPPGLQVHALLVAATGFLAVVALGRYLLKPLVRVALTDRVAGPGVGQFVAELVDVLALLAGVWVGLSLAGLGEHLPGTATVVPLGTLAVGVAARDVVEDLVSGLFLIRDPQLAVGDWIEWNDERGVLVGVGLRAARVRTFDDRLVVVPNSALANSAVTNHGDLGRIRLDVRASVAYDADVDAVRELMVEAALGTDGVGARPAPRVLVTGLGDAVGLKLEFWTAETTRDGSKAVRSAVAQRVTERFAAENVGSGLDGRNLTSSDGQPT